jgi:hypothetical protein
VKAALQTLSEQAAEHGEFLRRAQSLVDAFRFDALRSLLQYRRNRLMEQD